MIVNFTKSEMSACAGILFFLKAHGHQSTYHALKACLQTQKKNCGRFLHIQTRIFFIEFYLQSRFLL